MSNRRATWYPARGRKNQGGVNYVPSVQVSAQDVVLNKSLKVRKEEQTTPKITKEMLEAIDKQSKLLGDELKTKDIKAIEDKVKEEEEKIKQEIKSEETSESSEDDEEDLRKDLEECEDEDSSEDSKEEIKQEVTIKRKWFDDTVFKNQCKDEKKHEKRCINDTLRNDYHLDFLDRVVK